jgi:opacity protein-like surface antigen
MEKDIGVHARFAMRTLLLVLVLCVAGSAWAQSSEPEYRQWEVAGFAGGSFGNTFHFRTPVFGSDLESSRTIGMQYSPGYQVGIRLNEYFNEYWFATLEYNYALQNLRFTNVSPDNPTVSANNYIHHIDYNIAFTPRPPTKQLRPYFDIGTGAILFFINGESLSNARQQGLILRQSTWQFLFNCGGGVNYLVMDRFAISADVKATLSGIPRYAIPSSAQVVNGQFIPGIGINGVMQTWQVSGSANYQWDEWNFRRRRRGN